MKNSAIPEIKRGTYLIIRVDGTEVEIPQKPSIAKIHRDIECQGCDAVILDQKNMIVMIVDDTGMVDRKPVNNKATALYHAICKPGTVHVIHGDVAIVNDEDFA